MHDNFRISVRVFASKSVTQGRLFLQTIFCFIDQVPARGRRSKKTLLIEIGEDQPLTTGKPGYVDLVCSERTYDATVL